MEGRSALSRCDGPLASALARLQHKFAYAKKPDWATPAAAYTFGLAKNHGFVDGNKRVVFLAAYVFLGLNGYDLDVTEPEVAATIDGVAAGTATEPALTKWFPARIRR